MTATTGTPNADELLVQQRGAARWLTLNRPAALNTLGPTLLDAILAALADAAEDSSVAAVVITGAGRAFCAGADLEHVQAKIADGGQMSFLAGVNAVFNTLEAFPKPTIAAVNGITAAGGLELLLCCDFAVAASSARIGDAHANYGLLPGGGASIRLPRRVNLTVAKYLLYTGKLLPAEDLTGSGLLLDVVADHKLGDTVEALVADLSEKSPLAFARVKQLVQYGLKVTTEVGLEIERVTSELHLHSRDVQEGVDAFTSKRPPRFQGV